MNKQRKASGISFGIFLISLGILIISGWWWPGIMFAIGLSAGAELVFRGKVGRGIGTLVFFSAIPIVVWIFQEVDIPWSLLAPMILIGIGVIVLVKTFFLGGQGETER